MTGLSRVACIVLINISPSNILQLCLSLNNFIKIVRLVLVAVNINGLKGILSTKGLNS